MDLFQFNKVSHKAESLALTTDAAKLPNRSHVITATAHFILRGTDPRASVNGKLTPAYVWIMESGLIAFDQEENPHTAANIVLMLTTASARFNYGDKLVAGTTDGGANMVAAMATMFRGMLACCTYRLPLLVFLLIRALCVWESSFAIADNTVEEVQRCAAHLVQLWINSGTNPAAKVRLTSPSSAHRA